MADAPMFNDLEMTWQYSAACRGEEAELFFAPNYFERKEEKEAREARAKAVCARCEVRAECLDYALRTREPHGIWGGLNEVERKALLREREREAG
jgi:WhiB family redox-sensing transcriptional regulator